MKRYQSLALQELNITVPGLRVRRLALHRHLAGTTALQPHSHPHAQCLLYVIGRGRQQIAGRRFEVQAGSVVFVPPRVEHAFLRGADRRPVCLVVEVDWRGAARRPAAVGSLSQASFREAQQLLATLMRLQRKPMGRPPLQLGAVVLRLVDLMLSGLGMIASAPPPALSPIPRRVERVLTSPDAAGLTMAGVAGRVGYQRDYLNRLLKAHTGMTLGQMHARVLLGRAEHLLRGSAPVGQVAGELGFADANYFARWFRRQMGSSPTAWRKRGER